LSSVKLSGFSSATSFKKASTVRLNLSCLPGLSGEPVILIEDQDDAVRVVIHYVRHVPAPAMLNTAGNFDVTGHAVYRRDKQ
jgi:hypothetical protein